jgi:hypothetical protein
MARISLFQSAALAVLAAVGTMAIPAHAQDQEPDRQEARAAMQHGREMRAERQAERQQQAPQAAAPQEQAQAADSGRSWNRGGGGGNGWQGRSDARQQQSAPAPQQATQGSGGDRWNRGGGGRNGWQGRQAQQQSAPSQATAPEGGWRSQRGPEGQRYGRDWDNGGAVSRPAPAWNGADPRTAQQNGGQWRQRGEAQSGADWASQRNRTYSDPSRNGSYGNHGDPLTAQDWRNRQGDRNGSYGDQRSSNGYRDQRNQSYGYQNGYASRSRDNQHWDRNDWRRDNRYNWSGYRTQHRDLYRAGRYYSPYNNYSYSRLSIGFFLNSGFYGQNNWINDPYQYRLPEAYGPYRWVRYYDDVLLVDIYTGEVVDVIHDFFW